MFTRFSLSYSRSFYNIRSFYSLCLLNNINYKSIRNNLLITKRFHYDDIDDFDFDDDTNTSKQPMDRISKPKKTVIPTSTGSFIMLVDEFGEIILSNTTKDKVLQYARKHERTFNVVMQGKGKNTVYKLNPLHKKEEKNEKAKYNKKVKEVRFSNVILEHDINFKLNKVSKFLQKGNPVKMSVISKVMNQFNPDENTSILNDFISSLDNRIFKIERANQIERSNACVCSMLIPKMDVIEQLKQEENRKE